MSSPTSRAVEAAKQNVDSAVTAARDRSSGLKNAADGAVRADRGLLQHPYVRAALPFVNGGLAGMTATTVIQPVDMIKVRLQLAGEGVKTGPRPSPLAVTRDIVRSGKALDLYTGLSAGLLRQAVYTTARLGFFDTFMNSLKSGATAMLGNPADLALIRMQSDGLKPRAQRANYRSALDALVRISRAEGVAALWAGAFPTVVRAMALNFGQLAFFSEAKQQLSARTDLSSRSNTLAASAVAGFFASFFSLPFDFVKTRLQKQHPGPDGKLPYRNMFDCFAKVASQEGLLRFYRGFGTYYVRIAPHAMVTLIVADYLGWITR